MKQEHENIFYTAFEISGISFKVFASPSGIKKISINSKRKPLEDTATKLHEDDPYLFGIYRQLTEYFNNERKEFTLPLDISGYGTPFQQRVWEELRKIPYGKTISYKTLSENIGDLKAIRAVGKANGANPVPIIIPCHRVINADGTLGGFSCGIKVKEKLLELEGCLSLELF